MFRLTMVLMCLIAALSGTPLRQAEAASDFARSLAEVGAGQSVETIDGGVGDDSGETVLKAGSGTLSLSSMVPLVTSHSHFTPILAALAAPEFLHRRPTDGFTAHSAGTGRRHAWLQCFRF